MCSLERFSFFDMSLSDKEQLVSMGFPEQKVIKALNKTNNSGLQPAIDYLLQHQNDPDVEETATKDDGEITADQQTAQSLKCDDCGKLLRDAAAAEVHATKTTHQNFSESTLAIKPLTAEEKALKLQQVDLY